MDTTQLNISSREVGGAENGWFSLRGQTFPHDIFLSSVEAGSAGRSGAAGANLRSALIDTFYRARSGKSDRAWVRPVLSCSQVHSMDIVCVELIENGGWRVDVLQAKWLEGNISWKDGIELLPANELAVFSADQREQLFEAVGTIEADGIICDDPGLGMGVTVADCLPIFLSFGRWRGILHSGWKGTGILHAALSFLESVTAASETGNNRGNPIQVVFGPCISVKNYQVSPERAELFKFRFGERGVRGRYLDIRGANTEVAGWHCVKSIESWTSCTVDHSGLFSYRQSGAENYGSMFAFYPAIQ